MSCGQTCTDAVERSACIYTRSFSLVVPNLPTLLLLSSMNYYEMPRHISARVPAPACFSTLSTSAGVAPCAFARARLLPPTMAERGVAVVAQKPAGVSHGVALCIGNSKYASSPLRNAANDAEDVAEKLRALGFATELLLEASLAQMLDAVEAFVVRLQRGGVSVFFYAGAPSAMRGCR